MFLSKKFTTAIVPAKMNERDCKGPDENSDGIHPMNIAPLSNPQNSDRSTQLRYLLKDLGSILGNGYDSRRVKTAIIGMNWKCQFE